MTDSEFFALCQRHDWTYQYSDDHSVWRRGSDAAAKLRSEAEGDPVKTAMLHDYSAYALFHGDGERPTKPNVLDYIVADARKIGREIWDLSPEARQVISDALVGLLDEEFRLDLLKSVDWLRYQEVTS